MDGWILSYYHRKFELSGSKTNKQTELIQTFDDTFEIKILLSQLVLETCVELNLSSDHIRV